MILLANQHTLGRCYASTVKFNNVTQLCLNKMHELKSHLQAKQSLRVICAFSNFSGCPSYRKHLKKLHIYTKDIYIINPISLKWNITCPMYLIDLGVNAIVADLDFGTSSRSNLFYICCLSRLNAFLNKKISAFVQQ